MKSKICSKCKKSKKLITFSKDKNRKSGYYPYCKICCKKRYEENKDSICKQTKNYREENKKIIAEKRKQYEKENAIKIKKQRYKRYHSDVEFKTLCNLRVRLWCALHGTTKSGSVLKLLGCSVKFLKKHLEKQFKPGMCWKNHNYYGWHIDHIKPCSKFDLTKISEQYKCFHYTNLQPMWADDNRKKSDNYENKSF